MTAYPEHWVRLDRDTPIPVPPQVDDNVILPPEPGTGTLWVRQSDPGVWWALWQGDIGFVMCQGSEQEVIAWAKEQPVPHVNLIAEVSSGGEAIAEPDQPVPEPGTGTVWVTEYAGVWHAGWVSEKGAVSFESADRETALSWARARPSQGMLLSENGLPHVPP